MSRLKPSERTDRRIQMFIDRGYFKHKTDVLDAAVELLVKHQMELDAKKQAEEYTENPFLMAAQLDTNKTKNLFS